MCAVSAQNHINNGVKISYVVKKLLCVSLQASRTKGNKLVNFSGVSNASKALVLSKSVTLNHITADL